MTNTNTATNKDVPAAAVESDDDQRVPTAHNLLINLDGQPVSVLTSKNWLSLQRFFFEVKGRPDWLENIRTRFKKQGHSEEGYSVLLDSFDETLDELVDASLDWDDVYGRIVNLSDDIVGHARKSETVYEFMEKMIKSPSQEAKDYGPKMKVVIEKMAASARSKKTVALEVMRDLAALQERLASDDPQSVLSRFRKLKSQTDVDSVADSSDDILTFADLVKEVGDLQDEINRVTARLAEANEEYEHAVTVAATSPTYAWVPIPFPGAGLVAAVVVSAVFGAEATELSTEIDSLQTKLRAATQSEQNKTELLHLLSRVDGGVTDLLRQLEAAAEQLMLVQRAWGTIANDHEEMAEAITQLGLTDEFARQMAISDAANIWKLVKTKADFFRQAAYISVTADASIGEAA